jgi:hypothetical protein
MFCFFVLKAKLNTKIISLYKNGFSKNHFKENKIEINNKINMAIKKKNELAKNNNARLPGPNQNPPPMPDPDVKQIEDCFYNSLHLINLYTPFVPDSFWKRKTGITLKNQPYLFEAIELAQQFPATRPATLDIAEWLNDIRSYNIFIGFYRILDAGILYRAYRIFAVRAWHNFSLYYQNVRMLGKAGDVEAQTIYEKLKTYYDRRPKNIPISAMHDEDLKMEEKEFKRYVETHNMEIEKLLKKEFALQKELQKDIRKQENILEK